MHQKIESKERSIVLVILRTTGVVTLIEEGKFGEVFRQYYRNSVVLPTKTLKALGTKHATPAFLQGEFDPSKTIFD